jgi:hypothetical protein
VIDWLRQPPVYQSSAEAMIRATDAIDKVSDFVSLYDKRHVSHDVVCRLQIVGWS